MTIYYKGYTERERERDPPVVAIGLWQNPCNYGSLFG